MKNHLMALHKNHDKAKEVVSLLMLKVNEGKRKKNQLIIKDMLDSNVKKQKSQDKKEITQENFDKAIALWIAAENKSFSSVESQYFKNILESSSGNFNFKIKSADFFRNRVKDLFVSNREIIKLNLAGISSKLSYTTDCWTSPNMKGFMSITVHFVDNDFKIRTFLLDFINLTKKHTGDYLSDMFMDSICEFGLEKKIGTITMDNASNNKAMIKELCTKLALKGVQFSAQQGIPCFDHILNLAVQAFINKLEKSSKSNELLIIDKEFEDSDLEDTQNFEIYKEDGNFINELRKSNYYIFFLTSDLYKIKNSLNFLSELRSYQLQSNLTVTKIVLDVKTRWNSCFHMLEWSLANKDALIKTLPEMESLNWELFSMICSFLAQFDKYTKKYSTEKSTPIAKILMDYDKLIENVRSVASKNSDLSLAAGACLDKLEKYYIYFDYPVYYISTCNFLLLKSIVLNSKGKQVFFKAANWQDKYIELAYKSLNAEYQKYCLIESLPVNVITNNLDK